MWLLILIFRFGSDCSTVIAVSRSSLSVSTRRRLCAKSQDNSPSLRGSVWWVWLFYVKSLLLSTNSCLGVYRSQFSVKNVTSVPGEGKVFGASPSLTSKESELRNTKYYSFNTFESWRSGFLRVGDTELPRISFRISFLSFLYYSFNEARHGNPWMWKFLFYRHPFLLKNTVE